MDRPELWPPLIAFEQPIPWGAIDTYADRHGFHSADAFDRLRRMVRAQDDVYLEHMEELAKKSQSTET